MAHNYSYGGKSPFAGTPRFYKLTDKVIVSRTFLHKVDIIAEHERKVIFLNGLREKILSLDVRDLYDLDSSDEDGDDMLEQKSAELMKHIWETIGTAQDDLRKERNEEVPVTNATNTASTETTIPATTPSESQTPGLKLFD